MDYKVLPNGSASTMESMLRREPTDGYCNAFQAVLHEYKTLGEFMDAKEDIDEDWEFCFGSIYDIENHDGKYMVVNYYFDEYAECQCSEAFDEYDSLDDALSAMEKQKMHDVWLKRRDDFYAMSADYVANARRGYVTMPIEKLIKQLQISVEQGSRDISIKGTLIADLGWRNAVEFSSEPQM